MESIERAIRNAFAKADAHNAATRQRIYEAAWGAHERALATNAALSTDQKEQRRDKLKTAISRIEQEFAPERERDARKEPQAGASPELDPVLEQPIPEAAPTLDTGDIRSARGNGRSRRESADLGYEGGKRGRKDRKKKRHSPLYSYGIPALILIVAGMIAYSLYNSYADFTRGSSSNPLLTEGNIGPLKEGEEPGGRKWINIFTPSEATRLSVQGRATAEIQREGNSSFARLQSHGDGDTITFDIGEGVLNQLAGKKATFNIVARSDDGKLTQMSVSCNLAGLGDCGRRRYDVGDSLSDFLFDIEFPQGKNAGGAGTITINSDLSGSGKLVDIYAIRVTTATE